MKNVKAQNAWLLMTIGTIVEYQQNGKNILGLIQSTAKDKFEIFNETGASVFLPATRLFSVGNAEQVAKELNKTLTTSAEKIFLLKEINERADNIQKDLNIEQVYELLVEDNNQAVDEATICELFFSELDIYKKLAVHHLLLDDNVFFKRDKSGLLFEPRSADVIEELKKKQIVEEKKRQLREKLVEAIISILSGKKVVLPDEVTLLEQYSALGSKAFGYKNAISILEEVQKRAKITLSGRNEEKAFALLVKVGHFHKDENLALYKVGRYTKFDAELEAQATELVQNYDSYFAGIDFVDLTDLEIFSIDSATTKDIDDALSFEMLDNGQYRVGIHITDVADLFEPNTDLFKEAMFRASSLYFPEQKVHMLPQVLSEKACSLVEGQQRFAMSFFLYLDTDFNVLKRDIQGTKIIVKTRFDYDFIDEKLKNSNLDDVFTKLYKIARKFENDRMNAGAVTFQRNEILPVILPDGKIALEKNVDDTPARKLVSELMVAANMAAALFAKENSLPIIYRSQEAPEVNPKTLALDIPEGVARNFLQCAVMKKSLTGIVPQSHSGLGVQAYSQLTSPIRRAGDLLNQKQIFNFIRKREQFFTANALSSLAEQIDESLQEARLLQRERNRYWLLKYIIQEKWTELDGTVLKTEGVRNPLVELDTLHLIWNFDPLPSQKAGGSFLNKPGDRVRLRIKKIDPDTLVMRLSEI